MDSSVERGDLRLPVATHGTSAFQRLMAHVSPVIMLSGMF